MPLCTLYLLSLNPQTTLKEFITSLKSYDLTPLTISRVVRWIIVPEEIDTAQLLEPIRPYDLLLILNGTDPLPGPLESKTSAIYTLQIGVPSRLLKDFSSRNQNLLHPSSASSVPKLTGALDNDPIVDPKSSQTLTLSPELQGWIKSFSKTHAGQNAVSMLNLLSFRPGKKESYLQYGKAFAESIGSHRGGDARLVGHVVYSKEPRSKQGGKPWDEFALAHYPSILHFADMLASKDYQDVNQKYRVPALNDTCILCTSEIAIEEIMKGEQKAKL